MDTPATEIISMAAFGVPSGHKKNVSTVKKPVGKKHFNVITVNVLSSAHFNYSNCWFDHTNGNGGSFDWSAGEIYCSKGLNCCQKT